MLPGDQVGFTAMPKWACFSVVKNACSDAIGKLKSGLPADCPVSGEAEFFFSCWKFLCAAFSNSGNCDRMPDPPTEKLIFNGVSVDFPPLIILRPSFFPTLSEMVMKVRGSCKIAGKELMGAASSLNVEASRPSSCCLVISGASTRVENLEI